MGHLYPDHGNVSIEGRQESFIIHAGYGIDWKRTRMVDLRPGEMYVTEIGGKLHQVLSQGIEEVVFKELGYEPQTVHPDDAPEVIRVDDEEMPVDGEVRVEDDPLGDLWKGPHPEFDLDDLDHLISALEEYRDRIRS